MIINVPEFDPVALSFYFIKIRWYSLAYIFGVVYAYLWIKRTNQQAKYLSEQALEDWLLYIVLAVIIGGRCGYVFFYNPRYFFNNPQEILAFWHGGMSFHGGLLGVIFGMYLFAQKYHIKYWTLMDHLAVCAPFGICLGRLANFVNLELYGRPTSEWFSKNFFGFVFPNSDMVSRHPSQLYEALLEGLVLLVILTLLYFKTKFKNYPQRMSGVFLIGYSIARFICEFFREPDQQIGYFLNFFSMGQILSLPIMLIGVALIISSRQTKKA